MRTAIYPGTFDPITYGHLDVIERACHIFDRVIVSVAPNAPKGPLFTLEERIHFVEELIPKYPNASVQQLEGLTVDFARKLGAIAVVRGLRAISDFEYEFQMAQMNRQLADDIETIFLMPRQDYFYTSSKLVKAVAEFSTERIDNLVPPNVLDAMTQKSKGDICTSE